MNTWVQVDKLQDSESLNSKTLNRPVDQLASRTDYLKKRLGSILNSGVQSSLILTDVTLVEDDKGTISVGNIVYRREDGFAKAQAEMHLYDNFTAADSAFTLGIVVRKNNNIGDVLIYGKLDLGPTSQISPSTILQEGETFRSGRYYVSSVEPGKLTSNPNGPLIYVCSIHSDSAGKYFSNDAVSYVNPQFLDIGTSHVHRAYTLMSRPAGHVDGNTVIGYLPLGASYSSSESSSDSSSTPVDYSRYPSLIFGGTIESIDNITYTFSLQGNTWGNVRLTWYKNGNTSVVGSVDIPSSDVFVDIDNGLKVKVILPEATSSKAYIDLLPEERTWVLEFPKAGRGWLNHSVEAIASNILPEEDSSESPSGVTPTLHAVIRGSWPQNDNTVCCLFPGVERERTINNIDVTNTITIGSITYEFVAEGETPEEGNVAVTKAATVEESLFNLAKTANESYDSANVFVSGKTLYVCDTTIDGTDVITHNGIPADGVEIVGKNMPITIVYDANYELVGSVLFNRPNYVTSTISNLKITVFSRNATDTNNYTCLPGTRLKAVAYDYAPKAAYDYVMGLHPEVDYYFPPVPAQAAGLFVNGVEMENAALFPDNPTYLVGRKTLHWMESDPGRRPWPQAITDHDTPIDPSLDKTMVFYFIVGFQCASGPVTSLVPAPGSQIKMYTYGTKDEAYTGDLMIDAALDFEIDDAGIKGYNVAKQGKGGKLLAGPVVERIKAGSGISITQEAGCPDGQGTVTVALDNGSLRGHFNEIALENAKQEKIGLFPYISLLGWGSSNNIPSAFTAMLRVPSNLDINSDYRVDLRMVMFGAAGYDDASRKRAAGIQLEYNILPDYTDKNNLSLKTGLLVPDNPRKISVPLGHKDGTTYKYVSFDPFVATTDVTMKKEDDVCVSFSDLPLPSAVEFSTKIPELKPGYLLAVRISRIALPDTVSYDAYTGQIGFLSMEWTIKEA